MKRIATYSSTIAFCGCMLSTIAYGDSSLSTSHESLPQVLLIGDSISMGYTAETRKFLAGKAHVHRPAQNCSSTEVGLRDLDSWLGNRKWDVIHFNFGLHDVKYGTDAKASTTHNVPADQYEKNLEELVSRLKKTHAKLIFATTTPIPEDIPRWVSGDAEAYNMIARKVMNRHGIPVNDLFRHVAPKLKAWQLPSNVHFSSEGSKALAEKVASSIEVALDQSASPVEKNPDLAFPHEGKVCFAGDSITHGGYYHVFINLFYSTRYPNRKLSFINAGIGGHTIPKTLTTSEWNVIPHQPDLIVLMLGMNDLRVSDRLADYLREMPEFLAYLDKNTDARLMLLTATPYDETTKIAGSPVAGANSRLKAGAHSLVELGREMGIPVIDLFTPPNELNLNRVYRKGVI